MAPRNLAVLAIRRFVGVNCYEIANSLIDLFWGMTAQRSLNRQNAKPSRFVSGFWIGLTTARSTLRRDRTDKYSPAVSRTGELLRVPAVQLSDLSPGSWTTCGWASWPLRQALKVRPIRNSKGVRPLLLLILA